MNDFSLARCRAGRLRAEQREQWKMDWLSTVDHKRIGSLYMVTALGFFVIGGIEAVNGHTSTGVVFGFIPALHNFFAPLPQLSHLSTTSLS